MKMQNVILNGSQRHAVAVGSVVRFIYAGKQRKVQINHKNYVGSPSPDRAFINGLELDSGAIKSFTINKIECPIVVIS